MCEERERDRERERNCIPDMLLDVVLAGWSAARAQAAHVQAHHCGGPCC